MRFKINSFYYDDEKGIVEKKGELVQLTKSQKTLLNYLILHPNQTLSKQVLMDDVWQRVVNDNSVNKSISKLRGILEDDPVNPKIIVTVFGHGICFEGSVTEVKPKDQLKINQIPPNKFSFFIMAGLIAVVVIGVSYFRSQNPHQTNKSPQALGAIQNLNENQKLLILPTFFSGSENEQLKNGSNEMIKATFRNLNVKGEILFDESDASNKELMEKYWKIESDLVILHTEVVKKGEVYDAVMQFTKGYDTIKTITLTAKNLTELTNLQLQSVSRFHQGVPSLSESDLLPKTNKQKYFEALNYQQTRNFEKAKELLNEILIEDESSHIARYALAEVLLSQQKLDESLAQLNTLKKTPLYETRGAAIEFSVGVILGQTSQHQKLIENVDDFLASHAEKISPYRRSKLMLQKGRAYMSLGDMSEALKQYKLCIVDLSDQLFPDVFASSYLGQASILSMKSSNDEVIDLFYQALSYAEKHTNLRLRIVILNALSQALYAKNEWQEGITIIKQSIALMDTENTKGTTDKSEAAYGLSVLAMYLYEHGLLTEAEVVLERLDTIAKDLKSDDLLLVLYLHQIYVALYKVDYEFAKQLIDKQYVLAKKIDSFVYILNNTFGHLELLLQSENTLMFKQVYDERIKLFESESLERYRIYMHWFLARSYILLNKHDQAQQILNEVSELANSFQDTKLYVGAQISLSKSYMPSDPQKSLAILNTLTDLNPSPNPYLWVKAQTLVKLDRKLDALTALNQAKHTFNEAWSAENQNLLEQLERR